MAKDGSVRGGLRPGSGRKPKTANVITLTGEELPASEKPLPKIKKYLSAKQKGGRPFGARGIFKEMAEYLKAAGCLDAVPVGLIEQYAICVARWIQIEEQISETGFLAKHPTTGGAIASPYISASNVYMRQANYALCQIEAIVRENKTEVQQVIESDENDLIKKLKARIS